MSSGFGHRTPLGRCYPVYMVRACPRGLGEEAAPPPNEPRQRRPDTPRPSADQRLPPATVTRAR